MLISLNHLDGLPTLFTGYKYIHLCFHLRLHGNRNTNYSSGLENNYEIRQKISLSQLKKRNANWKWKMQNKIENVLILCRLENKYFIFAMFEI